VKESVKRQLEINHSAEIKQLTDVYVQVKEIVDKGQSVAKKFELLKRFGPIFRCGCGLHKFAYRTFYQHVQKEHKGTAPKGSSHTVVGDLMIPF